MLQVTGMGSTYTERTYALSFFLSLFFFWFTAGCQLVEIPGKRSGLQPIRRTVLFFCLFPFLSGFVFRLVADGRE